MPGRRTRRYAADFHKSHAEAEKLGTAIRADLLNGFKRLKATVDPNRIQQALRTGDARHILETVPWDKFNAKQQKAIDGLTAAGSASAVIALGNLPGRMPAELRYDTKNPRIRDHVERRFEDLKVATKEGMTEAVKQAVRRSYTNAATPREVASQIRGSIGLNAVQAGALANYRHALSTGDNALSPDRVDSLAADYEDRLLDQRAIMIARTEVRYAMNEGQADVWDAAQEEGLLPDDSKRVWVVDGDPCPQLCLPMDGVAVGLDEPWTLPDGREVDSPTESHPNCYCIQALDMGQVIG